MFLLTKILTSLREFKPQQHLPEFSIILLIAFYVFWYFQGKKRNFLLAKTWLQQARSLMQSQFSLLGDEQGHLLFKESNDEYIFYATGRKYCQSLYANLQVGFVGSRIFE
jgi:hypothetical protein